MIVEPAWRVFVAMVEKEAPDSVFDVRWGLFTGNWDEVADIAVGLSIDAENAFKRARAEREEVAARYYYEERRKGLH